jgi:o-succinylbenzoate synthase
MFMKIVDAEVFAIRIPLKHPFTIALGTLTHSNHVLVRMSDDDNRVGWGESTTFHSVYGYDQKSLYHVLNDHLLPAVSGMDPRNMSLLHQKMDQAIPRNLMAKCAVDLAAYDLAGQAAAAPIYSLIGGRRVDRIPVMAALGIVSASQAAARAKELVAEGFEVIKIKIGSNAEQDVERIKAVRETVGDTIRLRVDANQGYDRATARRVLTCLEPLALEWIEQPLPDWDLEGLAELTGSFDTPLAVDESVYTVHDARRVIAMKAADVVNIKVPKCGGIYRSQQIADVCQSKGIPCFLGGCLETSPGAAAQAHFYTATPNVISAAEMEPWQYVDDIVTSPMVMKNGSVQIPQGSGLGVVIDEDKVDYYRVTF